MGPNTLIWIAIAIMGAAMGASLLGYDWVLWVAAPIALLLAVANKTRAIRRRRTEAARTFD